MSERTPEEQAKETRFFILSVVQSAEQTEAHVFSSMAQRGIPAEIVSDMIDRMLDAGEVCSTVIDGGERFGFLPGLRKP